MGRLRQDLQDKKQIDLQQISGLDIEHFLEVPKFYYKFRD